MPVLLRGLVSSTLDVSQLLHLIPAFGLQSPLAGKYVKSTPAAGGLILVLAAAMMAPAPGTSPRRRSVPRGLMRQSRILNYIASLPYFHGRRLLYNALARLIPHDAVRSSYGVLLAKNPGDVTYRFAVLGKYGDFLQKIITALPAEGLFVDIGANQGVFTLIAAKHLHRGQVFAFEPNPAIHELLASNLALNDIENTKTLCAAICEKGQDSVELTFDPAHSGAASLTGGKGKKVSVRAVNRDHLDKIVENHRSEILVKVDVEGAEATVLGEPFASRLGRAMTGLVIELSQEYHSSAEIAAIDETIRRAGFKEASRRGKEGHYDTHYRRISWAHTHQP